MGRREATGQKAREDIAGLKDRINMAQSKEEQWFSDLREQVFEIDSHTRKNVGVAREELQLKQQELGQNHNELKAEVVKLGRRLATRESTL